MGAPCLLLDIIFLPAYFKPGSNMRVFPTVLIQIITFVVIAYCIVAEVDLCGNVCALYCVSLYS